MIYDKASVICTTNILLEYVDETSPVLGISSVQFNPFISMFAAFIIDNKARFFSVWFITAAAPKEKRYFEGNQEHTNHKTKRFSHFW
jgi:hypothetical protein